MTEAQVSLAKLNSPYIVTGGGLDVATDLGNKNAEQCQKQHQTPIRLFKGKSPREPSLTRPVSAPQLRPRSAEQTNADEGLHDRLSASTTWRDKGDVFSARIFMHSLFCFGSLSMPHGLEFSEHDAMTTPSRRYMADKGRGEGKRIVKYHCLLSSDLQPLGCLIHLSHFEKYRATHSTSRGRGEALTWCLIVFKPSNGRSGRPMMRHMWCASLGKWHPNAGNVPMVKGYKVAAPSSLT